MGSWTSFEIAPQPLAVPVQSNEIHISEVLDELFPHEQGFTYGINCYGLYWCNITVLHPPDAFGVSQVEYLEVHCAPDLVCKFSVQEQRQ